MAPGARARPALETPHPSPLHPLSLHSVVASLNPPKLASFGAESPLGRAAQPAELAHAYVFLASPATASYISGAVLGVTDGRLIG